MSLPSLASKAEEEQVMNDEIEITRDELTLPIEVEITELQGDDESDSDVVFTRSTSTSCSTS